MKDTGVPGVSLALYQEGKVVFSGGFGVRELGKPTKGGGRHSLHDRLQHQGDGHADARPVGRRQEDDLGHTGVSLLPTFKLGDAETTSKVPSST